MLQVNKTYSSVCAMAERHFMAIRRSVAAEEAPATLKAAFLEPISRRLATDLSIHLFARTDQHFMTWFACEPRTPPTLDALTTEPGSALLQHPVLHGFKTTVVESTDIRDHFW